MPPAAHSQASSVAHPSTCRRSAARSRGTAPLAPRSLRPRVPSPMRLLGPTPAGRQRGPALHRALNPAGPLTAALAGEQEERRRTVRQQGVNPAEESCRRCRLARSPPRTLHNGSARQGRAPRAPPVGAGRRSHRGSGVRQAGAAPPTRPPPPLASSLSEQKPSNPRAKKGERARNAQHPPPIPGRRGARLARPAGGTHSPPALEGRQVPPAQPDARPGSGAIRSPCQAGAAAPAGTALAARALASARQRLPAPPPLATIGRAGCPAGGRSRLPRSLR